MKFLTGVVKNCFFVLNLIPSKYREKQKCIPTYVKYIKLNLHTISEKKVYYQIFTKYLT